MKGHRIGVYLDFDNIYTGMLDVIDGVVKLDADDKTLEKISSRISEYLKKSISSINELNRIVDERTAKLIENDICYMKAFSDFRLAPYAEKIDITDILHSLGIKTFIPYIRKNKDMSDRAMIISIIEDLFFKQLDRNRIDKVIIMTGDIDYLPVIEFLSEYSKAEIYIMSFKSKLNNGYKDIFYLKNRIILLDEILDVDSKGMEKRKREYAYKEVYDEMKGSEKREKVLKNEILSEIRTRFYFKIDNELGKELFEMNRANDKK